MGCKSLTLIVGLVMATVSGSGVALAEPEILSDGISYQTLGAEQMSNIVGTQADASIDFTGSAVGLTKSNVTSTGETYTELTRTTSSSRVSFKGSSHSE